MVLVALASLALASSASAASVRVPAVFFGVNWIDPFSVTPEVRGRHLDRLQERRITEVRLPMTWHKLEPDPPNGDVHAYRWERMDPYVSDLAMHGVRVQPMLAYAPAWASNATPAEVNACFQRGAKGLAVGSPKRYAEFAAAIAKRYGQNGTFWAANPGVPKIPAIFYEIWNAPNTDGTWCPRVDPEGYGLMFNRATTEIRKVDPAAWTIVGGMGTGGTTQGGSVAPQDFINRMVTGTHGAITTWKNIMVGLHTYPGKTLSTQLNALPKFRGWLRTAGFPDSVPISINEIGFSKAGDVDFTESERVASYRNVTSQIPRSNCNILGMMPYAWTGREKDPNNPEDWFGIVSPGFATVYPSGQEYIHWADLFRGRLAQEAPRATIFHCPGMPPPDSDKDGTPDQSDYYPLNPTKV